MEIDDNSNHISVREDWVHACTASCARLKALGRVTWGSLGVECFSDWSLHQFEARHNASWVAFNTLCRQKDYTDLFAASRVAMKNMKEAREMTIHPWRFCKDHYKNL